VIVGNRQEGREHGQNIVHADYREKEISKMIDFQIKHGRYERSTIFGGGTAGQQIAEILSGTSLDIQKKMTY
jgi:hypothetical protein